MQRQIGLQWGRAIAALAVVVGHSIAHPLPAAPDFAHLLGRAGVTLFFVISGYIMVSTTGTAGFDPIRFMRKRITRIVPLYYVATAVLAVMAIVTPQIFKRTAFDIDHIVASLLFIPTYAPGTTIIEPFIKLGWTLNFEMFFYVCFALLFWAGAMQRAIMLSVGFGALMIAGMIWTFDAAIPEYYTRIDLLGFVAGVWLAVLANRYQWRMTASVAWGSLAVSLIGFSVMAILYGQIRNMLATQIVLVGLSTLTVGMLALGSRTFEAKTPKWAEAVGDATYSIYLFHMFAVGAVAALGRMFLPEGLHFIAVPVATVLGVAVGLFVYQTVELPLSRLAAGWRPRAVSNPT